uniref:DUF1677 family protein n=1 Tax=Leersia perrieri TaxID=77586 RepID=A0A0D9VYY2_9ORYZ
MAMEDVAVTMSCECCGLEEECTGEYIGGVRAYFGGRWLCGLCSEAVKYEAGKSSPRSVEEAVRAHMAFCRMLKRGGPAERVAEGMCQMLRRRASSSSTSGSSSSSAASSPSPSPRATAPEHHHHRAASTLWMQLI